MKKLFIVLMVLVLAACAELKVAADIVDIWIPDPDPDPCAVKTEPTIEKAMVSGVVVYRVTLGAKTKYENDELSALSEAAAMNTDRHFECEAQKIRKQRKTREDVIKGNVNPQWEKVK